MTLENNFINHSKEYIFSDNKILSNQRESTFKKILFDYNTLSKTLRLHSP